MIEYIRGFMTAKIRMRGFPNSQRFAWLTGIQDMGG